MKHLSMFAAVAALSSSAFAQEGVKIELSVSKDGAVSMAGRVLAVDELGKTLARLAKEEKVSEVVILAAKGAPLNATTAVLDACRKNGLNKIRIRTI